MVFAYKGDNTTQSVSMSWFICWLSDQEFFRDSMERFVFSPLKELKGGGGILVVQGTINTAYSSGNIEISTFDFW